MFVGMWHSFSQRISNLTVSPSCTQTNVPQIAISPGIRELEHGVVLMVVVRDDLLKEAMMFRRRGGNIHYVTMEVKVRETEGRADAKSESWLAQYVPRGLCPVCCPVSLMTSRASWGKSGVGKVKEWETESHS